MSLLSRSKGGRLYEDRTIQREGRLEWRVDATIRRRRSPTLPERVDGHDQIIYVRGQISRDL